MSKRLKGELKRTEWLPKELRKIAVTDNLHIFPFRDDGVTYGTATWIRSVVVDSDLYVRAYNGTRSRWYQAAMQQRAGRVAAAGITKNVHFEPVRAARSTTASTMPTGRSTTAAHISST